MEEKSFTVKQISSLFRVDEVVINNWISTGRIKATSNNEKYPISEENVFDFVKENPEFLDCFTKSKKNKKILAAIGLTLLGIPPIASDMLANKIINDKYQSPSGASCDSFDKTKKSLDDKAQWIKDHPEEFALIVSAVLTAVAGATAVACGGGFEGAGEARMKTNENEDSFDDYDYVYDYSEENDEEVEKMEEMKMTKYEDYRYKIKDASDEADADSYLEEALNDSSLSNEEKEELEEYICEEWGGAYEKEFALYDYCSGGDLSED